MIVGVAVAGAMVIAKTAAQVIVLRIVRYFVMRTQTTWDDALLHRRFFNRLAHLAPGLVLYFCAGLFPSIREGIERAAMVYMIMTGLFAFSAFLSAVDDVYQTFSISRQRPIRGYIQVARIILFVFVGIVAIATLMNRSPWLLLSGLGAMTAVLLLIFRDSILGLVASVQLSSNDMVRIGDWIEMPKYGADGEVVDVTLHVVKVRNWDNTITNIPSYHLIADSFKNWRGMQESGGRRIMRAVCIDVSSIRFCTPEMLDRFEQFQLITEYVRQRRGEIEEWNRAHGIDRRHPVNGRNMTNLGTFRAYVSAYLRRHPLINPDLPLLVRHREPTEKGLPLQIYAFSRDKIWTNYEALQADLFDHILAAVPLFDLRIFQLPGGHDVRGLAALLPQDHRPAPPAAAGGAPSP
ncbi:MAG TPA: mechanosensitive ion channel family protein [candidate division Zixibacteria bacterium]|nr:mechanosensitive ion channel family protein [candidate division Zixibacteria bacterium]